LILKEQNQTCGGTAHRLPLERKSASFDTLKMTFVLDGDPKKTSHRRWLWSAGEDHDHSHDIFKSREGGSSEYAMTVVVCLSNLLVAFLKTFSSCGESYQSLPGYSSEISGLHSQRGSKDLDFVF
jgi:hypothetical protein